MRPVLFVSTTGVVGGSETSLILLTRELGRAGRPCAVVVPDATDLADRLRAQGTEVVPWPPPWRALVERSAGGSLASRMAGRVRALAGAPAAGRWVAAEQRRRGALVHLNNFRPAMVAGDRAWALADARDALGPPFFGRPTSLAVARRLGRAAALVIANSAFIAGRLREYGFPAARIRVVISGIDLGRWRLLGAPERQAVRQKEGWGDRPVLLSAGRLAPWKGHQVAIRALPRLPDALLVIAGGAGFDDPRGQQDWLRREAAAAGVADRVLLAGERADVPDLAAAADVVLHASTRPEPLGLVPIEAQAVGTPLVAARSGGVPETVIDRQTGWLYTPGDPEALAEGVAWALAQDRKAYAAAARAHVERNFEIGAVAARYMSVYDELL